MSGEPTFWDWVPAEPESPLVAELVAIAKELVKKHDEGIILGDVVLEAERRGLRIGGLEMGDKAREQRQTSWLPRVMREAGLVPTERWRKSEVPRHHKRRQVVWVPRTAESAAA